jgi:hypothetical protein
VLLAFRRTITLGGMPDVTRLLEAAAAGDDRAAAGWLPFVYEQLRKLAAARMAAEAPGHTLGATALVHEAYLRLLGDQRFDGRGQTVKNSIGYAINDAGSVVGTAGDNVIPYNAVYWPGTGKTKDLNSLVPTDSGFGVL